MAIVAVASSTHFSFNGRLFPRNFTVYEDGDGSGAIITNGSRSLAVGNPSTIGGNALSDQAAIVSALAPIVMGAGASGGGGSGGISAAETRDAVRDASGLAPTGPVSNSPVALLIAIRDLLNAIDGVLPNALGQSNTAGSLSVTFPSDQAIFPTSRGVKTAANSFPVVIASDQAIIPVSPSQFTSASIVSVQTSSTGTNWVSFASASATYMVLENRTGVPIRYRRGSGAYRVVDSQTSLTLAIPSGNANEISVQRDDTSNVQVTVTGEIMS